MFPHDVLKITSRELLETPANGKLCPAEKAEVARAKEEAKAVKEAEKAAAA